MHALLDVNVLIALLDGSHAHYKKVTDVYLLAMAVQQGGRFVTLDRGIAIQCCGWRQC